MKDRGHEGPTFSRRELSQLAALIYSNYVAEWLRRNPYATDIPRPWRQLRPIVRNAWKADIRSAAYGGKITHPDPWVADLIRKIIQEEH